MYRRQSSTTYSDIPVLHDVEWYAVRLTIQDSFHDIKEQNGTNRQPVYNQIKSAKVLLPYGITSLMIPTTVLLPVMATLLWCHNIFLPLLPPILVVRAFDVQLSNHRLTRRYLSGSIFEETPCVSHWMTCQIRRKISLSQALAKVNELEDDVDTGNPASVHKGVRYNGTISSTTNTTSSDTVSSFNPFQYDASSVRMNNDRMRTVSSIRQNYITDYENETIMTTTIPTDTTSRTTNTKYDNRISIRAITMKQIMNEMINTVPDYDKVRHILQINKDFLLEVLEDDLAVQDEDSIYRNCTNRDQRYIAFQSHMNERIRMAQNISVQQILIYYREFVMSHHV